MKKKHGQDTTPNKPKEKVEKGQSLDSMIHFYNSEIFECQKPKKQQQPHTTGFLELNNKYNVTTKAEECQIYWKQQAQQYKAMNDQELSDEFYEKSENILKYICNLEDHCISFQQKRFNYDKLYAKEILAINEIQIINNKFEKSISSQVETLKEIKEKGEQYEQHLANISELLGQFRTLTYQISEEFMKQNSNIEDFQGLQDLGQVLKEIEGQYQFYKNFFQIYKQGPLNVETNDQQRIQQMYGMIEIKAVSDLNEKISILDEKITSILEFQKQAKVRSRSRSQEDRKEKAYDFTTYEKLKQFDFEKSKGSTQVSAKQMFILVKAIPQKVIEYFFQRFHFFIIEILVFTVDEKTFIYLKQNGKKQVYQNMIQKNINKCCYIYPKNLESAKIELIASHGKVILNRQKTFGLPAESHKINNFTSDLATQSITGNKILFIFKTEDDQFTPKHIYEEIKKIAFFSNEKEDDGQYFALRHGMNLTIFIQFKKLLTIIMWDQMNIDNTLKEIYSIDGDIWDFPKVFLKLQHDLKGNCDLLSRNLNIHKNNKLPLENRPFCTLECCKRVWHNKEKQKIK